MANEIVNLKKICCPRCFIEFWLSETHEERLKENKETFYCPSGHPQSYMGKTDKQKLEEIKKEKEKIKKFYMDACDSSSKNFNKWKNAEKELKKLKNPKVKKK